MDAPIPPKKARFEATNTERQDQSGNDLWGDGDFTAEEFDLLESQIIPNAETCNEVTDEMKKLKEQNYVLDGQLKMLRRTLDQNSKELDKERLEKMSMIENYSRQQKQEQKSFDAIKEQLETQLKFKNHELRTALEKIAHLEQKKKAIEVKNKASPLKNADNFPNVKHSKEFLDRNVTMKDRKTLTENKTECKETYSCQLNLWQKEQSTLNFVTSNILCMNRNSVLPNELSLSEIVTKLNETAASIKNDNADVCTSPTHGMQLNRINDLTQLPVGMLGTGNCGSDAGIQCVPLEKLPTFQIIPKIESSLKESLNIMNDILVSEDTSLNQVTRKNLLLQADHNAAMALQCLHHLLTLDSVRNVLVNYSKEHHSQLNKLESPHKVMETSEIAHENIHPLISVVLAASSPLFLEDECINESSAEWSLMVLNMLSQYHGERFVIYLQHINVCSLASGKCSLRASWLILQLLNHLLSYEFLKQQICTHSDTCIYRSLDELCQKIEKMNSCMVDLNIMTDVFDFISGMLRYHKVLSNDMTECLCIQTLFQSITKTVNKQIRECINAPTNETVYNVRKGISLLNIWSSSFSFTEEQLLQLRQIYVNLWSNLTPELKLV